MTQIIKLCFLILMFTLMIRTPAVASEINLSVSEIQQLNEIVAEMNETDWKEVINNIQNIKIKQVIVDTDETSEKSSENQLYDLKMLIYNTFKKNIFWILVIFFLSLCLLISKGKEVIRNAAKQDNPEQFQ